MLHNSSGTSVPPPLDSSKEQQDFKQVKLPNFPAAKKCPIVAVTIRPLSNEFEVTIARRYKPIKVYLTGLLSASRLVATVNDLRRKGRAYVVPQMVGWTAFVEAVYPPPSVTDQGVQS